jgi:hypothetical protein
MTTVPSFPTLQLVLIVLAGIGLAPFILRWYIHQNKEIALQNDFLFLLDDEKELITHAVLNKELTALVAAPAISTELRTLAATLATRADRLKLIREWNLYHIRNLRENAQRLLAID